MVFDDESRLDDIRINLHDPSNPMKTCKSVIDMLNRAQDDLCNCNEKLCCLDEILSGGIIGHAKQPDAANQRSSFTIPENTGKIKFNVTLTDGGILKTSDDHKSGIPNVLGNEVLFCRSSSFTKSGLENSSEFSKPQSVFSLKKETTGLSAHVNQHDDTHQDEIVKKLKNVLGAQRNLQSYVEQLQGDLMSRNKLLQHVNKNEELLCVQVHKLQENVENLIVDTSKQRIRANITNNMFRNSVSKYEGGNTYPAYNMSNAALQTDQHMATEILDLVHFNNDENATETIDCDYVPNSSSPNQPIVNTNNNKLNEFTGPNDINQKSTWMIDKDNTIPELEQYTTTQYLPQPKLVIYETNKRHVSSKRQQQHQQEKIYSDVNTKNYYYKINVCVFDSYYLKIIWNTSHAMQSTSVVAQKCHLPVTVRKVQY